MDLYPWLKALHVLLQDALAAGVAGLRRIVPG